MQDADRPQTAPIRVWRRVPGGRMIKEASDPSRWCWNSGAFVPKGGECTSVDLAAEREAAGHGPERVLDGCSGRWGVLEVAVEADLVKPDPLPGNPFHAELRGTNSSYRSLARRAAWVLPPRIHPYPGSSQERQGSRT